ncbi:Asialoglycoprotein receptor 1 [Entomortierella beljakovae]|nr:Asialoglycoprotein receptor 1 [Entomortierella beljakovae]
MSQAGGHPAYLGCFIDDPSSPDLTGEPPVIITRAEACFTHCSIGTFAYAAIRNRTICTCGDTYNKYGSAPASSCSTTCIEEQSVFDDCGGPKANSVYNVSMIIPKTSSPMPTVLPPGDDQNTSNNPNIDNGNNDQSSSGSKGSKAVVIIGSIAGAMVLLIILLLWLRRKRRPQSKKKSNGSWTTSNGANEKQRAMIGQSWFEKKNNKSGCEEYYSSKRNYYDDVDDVEHGRRGSVRNGETSMEAHLFSGFESSVFAEDHQHDPDYDDDRGDYLTRPSDAAHGGKSRSARRHQQGRGSLSSDYSGSTNISGAISFAKGTQASNIAKEYRSRTTEDSSKSGKDAPSTFASKIGSKFANLRVKTGLLQPQPSVSHGPLPVTPVSPISPISPVSGVSSTASSTMSGYSPQTQLPSQPPAAVLAATGGREERSPNSATPSFSIASAPIPGPASNRRGSTDIASLSSSLEGRPLTSQEYAIQNGQKFMDIYEPPSPISPTLPIMSSPPSPVYTSLPPINSPQSLISGSSMTSSVSISATSPRHQKQLRSNLIKDLILQGDSALEDKEMALMAQYQPYHCRQQQQQQQQQQHSRLQTQRGSVSLTVKTSHGLASKNSEPRQQGLAAEASSSSMLSVPKRTHGGDNNNNPNTINTHTNIPTIDTNYLAPPPRILIHKPL